MLKIELIGTVVISKDNQAFSLSRAKRIEALLVYLAVEHARPIRRETLLGLLFPESTETQARTALRQTLRRLRQQLAEDAAAPYLLVEKASLQFNKESDFQLDIHQFEEAIRGCAAHQAPGQAYSYTDNCAACVASWQEAIALYRGDFLSDFYLADCVEFEQWAEGIRAQLRQQIQTVLQRVITYWTLRNDYASAIRYARQLVLLDVWNEAAQRQLINLLAQSGKRTQALGQYEQLFNLLNVELGVEPEPQTIALIERIRAAQTERPHNLPSDLPSFVGRQADLAALHKQLAQPDKRLITVVGGGGMGKSRIALAIGRQIIDQRFGPFIDGVFFVSLVEVDAAAQLPHAIADALDLTFEGGRSAEKQLFAHLRDKAMLLILDNFEQLAETTAPSFLNRLLQANKQTKLLVTSRIQLHLSAAWTYELTGLPVPPADFVPVAAPGTTALPLHIDPQQHAALSLFIDRAARAMTGFAFEINDRAEQLAMLKICRLVEGQPLALELAAGWVRMMSCEQIAAEIERTIDLLQTRQQDVPDRHRSMRAVFDSSWQLLTEQHRQLLAGLSLFRGDFNLAAAVEICQTTPFELIALVEHSLLQRHSKDRYRMHELLRQFSAEKRTPTQSTTLGNQHATYFVRFTEQFNDMISSGSQAAALEAIHTEITHIRAAWHWVTAAGNVTAVDQLLYIFGAYFLVRSNNSRDGLAMYHTGLHDLTAALAQTDAPPVGADKTLCELMSRVGNYYYDLDQFEQAEKMLQSALNYSLKAGNVDATISCYTSLGYIARLQGRPLDALAYLQEAVMLSRQEKDQHYEGFAYLGMGAANIALGNHDAAERDLATASTLFSQLNYQFGLMHTLRWQGILAQQQGLFAEAQYLFEQSLTICQTVGNAMGQALVYNNLSALALMQEDAESAQQFSQQSLEIDAQNETPIIQAESFRNLGMAHHSQTNFDTSYRYLNDALTVASTANVMPLTLSIALDTAEKFIAPLDPTKAQLVAEKIADHDASDWATQRKAYDLQLALTGATADQLVIEANQDPLTSNLLTLIGS